MKKTDRIVAAIFAAGMSQGQPMGEYFDAYERCLEEIRKREKAPKGARRGPPISDAALAKAGRRPRR